MVKKNIINIKTFEQFQNDNKQYYPEVLQILGHILGEIKDTRQVDNWIIDGKVNLEPFTGDDDTLATHHLLSITNKIEGRDIDINWTFIVRVDRNTPDTDTTPGTKDYITEIQIDEVNYFTDHGKNEYNIVVDDQLSQIIKSILGKLNK